MELGTLILRSVGTKDQVADFLTKCCDTLTFERHRDTAFNAVTSQ